MRCHARVPLRGGLAGIAFVADRGAWCDVRPDVEQSLEMGRVRRLAAGQVEGDDVSRTIRFGVDFGREAADRTPERLSKSAVSVGTARTTQKSAMPRSPNAMLMRSFRSATTDGQLRQRRRRVCDLSVFADLGATIALSHRNRDHVLVDVQAYKLQ